MSSAYPEINLATLYGFTLNTSRTFSSGRAAAAVYSDESKAFLALHDIENKISTLKLRGYEDNTIPTNLTELNDLYQKTSLPLMPILSTSGITENSASINWSADPYPVLPITGYHFTLINNDNGQTIKQTRLMSGSRNSFETNLISGTNYKAYVIAINSQGNSDESNISFKTLGATPIVVILSAETISIIEKFDTGVYQVAVGGESVSNLLIESVKNGKMSNEDFIKSVKANLEYGQFIDTSIVIPPVVTLSAEVKAILTKFDNNDYEYPSWFNSNIGYVINGSITSNEFLNAFNNLLQAGTIIDKTIPVTITEFDVNVYKLDSNGNVFNDIHLGIDRFKLEELESKYFVTSVGTPTPTDQEIKDFYNYIDVDTSVKPTMVEARFLEFKIVDGYVEGKINFVATGTFTNYWKDKIIYAHFQVKDQAGSNILIGNEPKQAIKVNDLKFLLDNIETISYREYIGNIQAVTLEVYVWDITQEQLLVRGQNAFSYPKELEVIVYDGSCPTGYHKGFDGKCVLDGGKEKDIGTSLLGKVAGITALIGTLALLGSKSR